MNTKTKSAPADFNRALLDPESVFSAPADVVARKDLSRAQKMKILENWKYDTTELAAATNEGMPPGKDNGGLSQILAAIKSLG